MTRNEFKDRLAIQLIPIFTQMMATKAHQHVLAPEADPNKTSVTLPDPQIVTAHVYGYCEGAALVRDQHNELLIEALKKAKQAAKRQPKMEVARSSKDTIQ